MTLTDTSENALTSHLHSLIEKDDLDVLVLCEDDEDFLQTLLPLGCPQVSAVKCPNGYITNL